MCIRDRGPADELKAHGIPVLQDMPHVGRHLQDHIGVDFTWRLTVPLLIKSYAPFWEN